MILLLGIVALGIMLAIWERLDALHDDLSDLVYLLEDSGRPSRGGEDRETPTRRRESPR